MIAGRFEPGYHRMPIIEWSADLSVGHPDVDHQHQHLIALINRLSACLGSPGEMPEVAQTLTALRAYVQYHFAEEERLMRAVAYPGAAAHRRAHHWLAGRVHQMAHDFVADPGAVTGAALFDFLSDWLINHIRGEDLALRPWLLAAGAPPIDKKPRAG